MNKNEEIPPQKKYQIQFKTKIQEFSENNTIKNPKLLEMINDYLSYKKTENKNYFYFKKNHPNLFSFKRELFSSLENILNDILYMTNTKSQNEKIETVHKWYKTKINNYKELQFIQEHTKNLPNEKLTEFELKQNDERFIKNFHLNFILNNENDVENREKINTFSSPKNLIKNFSVKHVFNTFDKNKMINNKKVFYFNNKIKEIKSSFSFERPEYNFNILMANYNIIQSKNKMINEKRNLEEIKSNLNDFGKIRARFVSENNNKYELINLIEKYKNNKKNLDENINDETKNDFKNIFKELKKKNDKKTNYDLIKGDLFVNKKLGNNFTRKLISKSKTTVELIFNKNKRKKIIINNIKNISFENIIIQNENEKIYNFKAKLNISSSKWTIFENLKNNLRKSDDENKNNENIKPDLIYKFCNNDKIFETRFKYQTICNLNKIDSYKDNYKIVYKPMSVFDITNFNTKINFHDSFENFKTNASVLNKTNNEKKWIKNHNEGNFLEMRKTLLNFNLNEFNILRNSLKKSESASNVKSDANINNIENKKNYKKTKNILTINETIFNNYEKEYFPKLYLPRSGSGLLNFPPNYFINDNNKNKKKKK